MFGLEQANVYLGLLQDTKITGNIYARESVGFCVISLDAPRCHLRVVTIFYKESPRFVEGAHQQNGLNIINFQMEKGGRLCYMVDFYIALHDTSTL